jgi:DNA polymerase-3 subunit alpha
MAALMTGYCSNSDKVALYIADCRRQDIEVLPPDINESEINFTVVDEKRIRFGLAAVKNVGTGAIESILAPAGQALSARCATFRRGLTGVSATARPWRA